MTPNPTARPFVLGALFFVLVLAGWQPQSIADHGPSAPTVSAARR